MHNAKQFYLLEAVSTQKRSGIKHWASDKVMPMPDDNFTLSRKINYHRKLTLGHQIFTREFV